VSDPRKSKPQNKALELDWEDAADAFHSDLSSIDGEDDDAIFPPDLIDSMIESTLSEPGPPQLPAANLGLQGLLRDDYDPASPLLPGSVASGRSSAPPPRQSVIPLAPTSAPEGHSSLSAHANLLGALDDLAPPPLITEGVARAIEAPTRERMLERASVPPATGLRARSSMVSHPLAAPGESGKRARIDFLCALAQAASGSRAASLLTSAAVVCEELGDDDRAEDLYRQAVQASPSAVVARRALGRFAFASKRDDAAEERLRSEALAEARPGARAWTLHRLAIAQWLLHRDVACALRTVTEAVEVMPTEPAHALLRLRLATAAQADELAELLLEGESKVEAAPLRAVLLVMAGRRLERRGERDAAHAVYARAVAFDARAFDAALGVVRTTPCQAPARALAENLTAVADALPAGRLEELMRTRAGRYMVRHPDSRARGLKALEGIARPFALLARVDGLASEDLPAATAVSASFAEAVGGEYAAVGYMLHAHLLRRVDNHGAANAAWKQALACDPDHPLALTRVSVLAEVEGHGDPGARNLERNELAASSAAARLAFEDNRSREELDLLARVTDVTSHGYLAAVTLDVALELGDRELAETLLGEEARSWQDGTCVGTWLALADLAARADDLGTAEAALALAASPENASSVGTRAAVRAAHGGPEASALFAREAGFTQGAQAAAAWMRAADATRDPQERLRLLKIAFDAQPFSHVALSALHSQARQLGELGLLLQVHARKAAGERNAEQAAAHWLRAALLDPDANGAPVAERLTSALARAPTDPVLRDLLLRRGRRVASVRRAEALNGQAEATPEPFATPLRLLAAAAYETSGDAARARVLYTRALADAPHDARAEAGWERTTQSTGPATEILEHRRKAVASAHSDASRVRALELLIDLDAVATPDEICEGARALLALRPQHPLALRKLEVQASRRGDVEVLFDVQSRSLAAARAPSSRLARLRMLSFLTAMKRRERGNADEFDHLMLRYGLEATPSDWCLRTLASAALAARDRTALRATFDRMLLDRSDATDRMMIESQRAHLALGEASRSVDLVLAQRLKDAIGYPTSDELAGELFERAGEFAQAAACYERAAVRARMPRRAARLWTRAAGLFAERLNDRPRALAAYRSAATADVSFDDVETRIQSILAQDGNVEALIAHTEVNLRAATEPAQRIDLTRRLARLRMERGDLEPSLQLMRGLVADHPEHTGVLRDVVEIHTLRGDARAKAEALLALIKASVDPGELRDALLSLARLYDTELPDAARAEAAYKRVLSLDPSHAEALRRLYAIYVETNQASHAEALSGRLLALASSVSERVEILADLSRFREERADFPAALATLHEAAALAPRDGRVVRLVAGFHRRRGDAQALAAHLHAAVEGQRSYLEEHLEQAEAWEGLADALEEARASDAAAMVRSLALALSAVPSVHGARPPEGAGSAGLSELLDDLVFPDAMPACTRLLFRYGSEALNRVVPFDPKAIGAQRLSRNHPFRALAEDLARKAGMGDLEILGSSALPSAFVTVADSPAQLVVGEELLENLDPEEQAFLTARALKIARSQASITCRIRPDEMGLLIHALIRTELPQHAPPGHAAAALENAARRIAKQLSRKQVTELAPILRELAQSPGFDASRVYTLASGAGNRAGLLVTGSPRAALSGLLKLAGRMPSGPMRVEHVVGVEEARDLLSFALRDAHFEARQRAGADQR
jgi:tetratricopeptide (TPR) repeat protein